MTNEATDLQRWARDLVRVVGEVEDPGQRLQQLTAIPVDGEPVERLRRLRRLMESLGLNLGEADPTWLRTDQLARRIGQKVDAAKNACVQLLDGIQREVDRLTVAGVTDPDRPVILTAPFRPTELTFFDWQRTGGTLQLAAVTIDALTPDHELRGALPREELFYARHLVLGPTTKDRVARPWYDTASAMELTRSLRWPQKEAELAQREREERRRREDERRFAELPEFRLQKAEMEIAELRQALAAKEPAALE